MPITKTTKLTNALVAKALKERTTPVTYRDTEVKGLILRVGPRSATYYLDYKLPGRRPDGRRWPSQTHKIGTPESHDVAAARKAAAIYKVQVNDGDDPAAERRQKRAKRAREEAQLKTTGQLVEEYIDDNLSGASNHHVTQRGALRRAIGEMQVEDMAASDVSTADVLEMLRLHKGRAMAVHRFGALDRFFADLVSRELVASNPCQRVPKAKRPKPPAPRTRYYSPAEMQALYNASGLRPAELLFIRCAILLPLRFGELANIERQHLDQARERVLLPAKLTKNGDPFSMPVPPQVFDLLDEANVDLAQEGRVFALSSTAKPFASHSALTERIRVASSVPDFNFHDLRRTFLTTLAELGVGDATVADALLNHRQSATRAGVLAAYNHASLWTQKVGVMSAWASLVHHAVSMGTWQPEGQVVELRRVPGHREPLRGRQQLP